MNGGTGNFLLEKAEAFALRIVRLYQHLSEKGERVMSKHISVVPDPLEAERGGNPDAENGYEVATGNLMDVIS